MLIRTLLLFSFFLPNAVLADNFDVQIGAFRSPDVTRIKLPENIGELRSTTGPGGLTRFVVGPFDGRPAAERARDRLRAAGYEGAFVRKTEDGRVETRRHDTTRDSAAHTAPASAMGETKKASSASEQDLIKLMDLSEEERRDLVYLDGKLHKKIGDKFIPVR